MFKSLAESEKYSDSESHFSKIEDEAEEQRFEKILQDINTLNNIGQKPSSDDSDDSSGFIINDDEVNSIYKTNAFVSEDDKLDQFVNILDALSQEVEEHNPGQDDEKMRTQLYMV